MHKAYLRRFGVEIECGMEGGYEEAAELFGFPFYDEDGYGSYPEYNRGDGWLIADDGSGVELCTPPLKGEEGHRELRNAMNKLADNGAYVTDYDGLHVHHDAPEFVENMQLCRPLLESWINNEETIREFVSPRRRDRQACPRWREGDLDRLDRFLAGDDSYYLYNRNDRNLAALSEHGTIEIRLLEGTLDADVAIAWIQFGQRLIHEVVQTEKPLRTVPDSAELLSRIKLSPQARAILAAKQAAGHNTPASRFRGSYYGDDY